MKLRIARKMDKGSWKRRRIDDQDKRKWWTVYSLDQLARAERRLRKSWLKHCPSRMNEDGRRVRSLVEDFFRANRVKSMLCRQRAIFERRVA